MRFRRGVVMVLVALWAFAGNAIAASADAEKQARRSFQRAETHFKAGLFAEALAEYQDGYERLPLPGFLINIAQCQRRLGALAQARATYRKFMLVAPDSPYVPEVKSLVAELDNLLDSPPAAAPPPGQAETSPVSPPSVATAPASQTLAGATAAPAESLVTVPASRPPPAATGRRWWLWGGIGAAVVAGTVTAIVLLRSPGTTTLHEGSLGTLRR
jgi:hypothetical protein